MKQLHLLRIALLSTPALAAESPPKAVPVADFGVSFKPAFKSYYQDHGAKEEVECRTRNFKKECKVVTPARAPTYSLANVIFPLFSYDVKAIVKSSYRDDLAHQVSKTGEIRLTFGDFDPRAFTFSADLDVTHPFHAKVNMGGLKTLKQRYWMRVTSCDGENIKRPDRSSYQTIRDLVRSFDDVNFKDYLSCEIEQRFRGSNFELKSSDNAITIGGPYGIEASMRLFPDQALVLRMQGTENLDGSEKVYYLKESARNGADVGAARESVGVVVDLFREYGDELLKLSLDTTITDAEKAALYTAYLETFRPRAVEALDRAKATTRPLRVLDKLSIYRAMDEAYATVEQIESKLSALQFTSRTLNLDKIIRSWN